MRKLAAMIRLSGAWQRWKRAGQTETVIDMAKLYFINFGNFSLLLHLIFLNPRFDVQILLIAIYIKTFQSELTVTHLLP